MITIADKLKRVRSTQQAVGSIISDSIMNCEHDIVYAIQGQLWDGKNSKGQDITPSYLEDTFFKTMAAAVKYAKWKAGLTPNSNRNYYAPNLYINGYFWSTMQINKDTLRIDAVNAFGKGIVEKYGEQTFALNPRNEPVVDKIRTTIVLNARKSLSL